MTQLTGLLIPHKACSCISDEIRPFNDGSMVTQICQACHGAGVLAPDGIDTVTVSSELWTTAKGMSYFDNIKRIVPQ